MNAELLLDPFQSHQRCAGCHSRACGGSSLIWPCAESLSSRTRTMSQRNRSRANRQDEDKLASEPNGTLKQGVVAPGRSEDIRFKYPYWMGQLSEIDSSMDLESASRIGRHKARLCRSLRVYRNGVVYAIRRPAMQSQITRVPRTRCRVNVAHGRGQLPRSTSEGRRVELEQMRALEPWRVACSSAQLSCAGSAMTLQPILL